MHAFCFSLLLLLLGFIFTFGTHLLFFGEFLGLFLSSLLLFVFSMVTMESIFSRITLHGLRVTLGGTFFKTRYEFCAGIGE